MLFGYWLGYIVGYREGYRDGMNKAIQYFEEKSMKEPKDAR